MVTMQSLSPVPLPLLSLFFSNYDDASISLSFPLLFHSSLFLIFSHYLPPSDLPTTRDPACSTVQPLVMQNIQPNTLVDPITPSRRRPACTPGLAGTNTAFLVADHIRKKFIDGWNVHVPLTYLTNKGCLFKNKPTAIASQELLTIDSVTGQIQTSSKPLSDSGELDLTFDEWFQAWQRLLELIRTHIPDELHLWEIHHSFIVNKENRAELWPLYLAYDVEIRKRSTQLPIDPSVFSIGIWNDLETRYTTKKVLSMLQSELKLPVRTSSSGFHYDNSDNSNQQGSWVASQTHSFRDRQSSSADPTKTGRCIFGGDRTKKHLSHNCTSECNTNGSPCHLHRIEPSGIRQSKSGKRYCYSWNGPSGCDKGSPCR